MDVTAFLLRFWGITFVIIGLTTVRARLFGKVIKCEESRRVSLLKGSIALILGAATIAAYLWAASWLNAAIGTCAVLYGIGKIGFQDRIAATIQKYKQFEIYGALAILLTGAFLLGITFFKD